MNNNFETAPLQETDREKKWFGKTLKDLKHATAQPDSNENPDSLQNTPHPDFITAVPNYKPVLRRINNFIDIREALNLNTGVIDEAALSSDDQEKVREFKQKKLKKELSMLVSVKTGELTIVPHHLYAQIVGYRNGVITGVAYNSGVFPESSNMKLNEAIKVASEKFAGI